MKQASYFKNKSNLLRYELFKKMSEMQQGHPGSIFSILDFLTVLFYGNFIKYSNFILTFLSLTPIRLV